MALVIISQRLLRVLLRSRLRGSADDRLRGAVPPQQQQRDLGVDVATDERLACVTGQAAEVEALREGARGRPLDLA